MYGSTLGYDDRGIVVRHRNRIAKRPGVELPFDQHFLSPFPSHQNVPYIFLLVNRRWRYLAESTHVLWNRISAMPSLSGNSRPTARFIQRWLRLAGDTLPLYLHIAPTGIATEWSEDDMDDRDDIDELLPIFPREEEKEEKATLGLFFQYANRCKALSVQLNKGLCQKFDEVLHPDSLQEPPSPFSSVETLELNTVDVKFYIDPSGWLSFFPALRHFRLTETQHGFFDLEEDLPTSRLETLYLDKHMFLESFVTLLKSCTSAKKVTLAGKLVGLPVQVPGGPKFELPNLTKISIRAEAHPGPLSLFDHFKLPNLVELEWCWTSTTNLRIPQDLPKSVQLLSGFLPEVGHRLKKLVIIDQTIQVKEIAAILRDSMVLKIPEVQVAFAVEWLGDVPGNRSLCGSHLWSPELLRFYVANRRIFESHGIDLLFWTLVDRHKVESHCPLRVREHIGWDRVHKYTRLGRMWRDTATGTNFIIGTRVQHD